jgi:transcriptional regulator with XRE-family HTH domain
MHIGANVRKLRTLKGIKQVDFARSIEVTQQELSRLENSEDIKDDMLKKIANKLGFGVEVIKNLKDDISVQSINQSGGIVFSYEFNPIDKIIELYEKLLAEKQVTIDNLQKILTQHNGLS